MKLRTLIFIYLAAFIAGAAFKALQYVIQPDEVADFNNVVLELTIVSVVVTLAVSIFYSYKKKK